LGLFDSLGKEKGSRKAPTEMGSTPNKSTTNQSRRFEALKYSSGLKDHREQILKKFV
jgi:hypothetical protein